MDTNYIESSLKKITNIFFNINSKTILTFTMLFALVIIVTIIGETKIINFYNFVFITIITISIYMYIKNQYKNKFNNLKFSNKMLKNNSILDDICNNKELSKKNKNLCSKYTESKKNFYMIYNLLIQKFNINE